MAKETEKTENITVLSNRAYMGMSSGTSYYICDGTDTYYYGIGEYNSVYQSTIKYTYYPAYVGGIVGSSSSKVTSCYNAGRVVSDYSKCSKKYTLYLKWINSNFHDNYSSLFTITVTMQCNFYDQICGDNGFLTGRYYNSLSDCKVEDNTTSTNLSISGNLYRNSLPNHEYNLNFGESTKTIYNDEKMSLKYGITLNRSSINITGKNCGAAMDMYERQLVNINTGVNDKVYRQKSYTSLFKDSNKTIYNEFSNSTNWRYDDPNKNEGYPYLSSLYW